MSRLVITRSAPARAHARANVWPKPRLTPVTIATLPTRLNIGWLEGSVSTNHLGGSRFQDHFQKARFFPVKPIKPSHAFSQGRDGSDEVRRLENAARQQIQTLLILTTRSTRTKDIQFSCDRGLQWKLDNRRHISYKRYRTAFASATKREVHRSCDPNSFADNVSTETASQGQNRRQRLIFGGVNNMSRAAFLRHGEPLIHHVHNDDRGASHMTQKLRESKADHAGAKYNRRIILFCACAFNGMQGNGERLDQ